MRLAPLGRRSSCFGSAAGSRRSGRRTDGGDLEEETRRSRRMKRASAKHSCMAGERLLRLQRAGRAGSAKGPGGQHGCLHSGRPRSRGGCHQGWWRNAARAREQSSGRERAHGKSSNARPATVKAKEGAREANDSLPCTGRGIHSGVIREPRHLATTSCIALGSPSSSCVMSRLLPIGLPPARGY
jgi:hypothetical protein